MRNVLLFVFFVPGFLTAQILFTAIDHSSNDVRACLLDDSTNEIIEVSFNNSYLPVWLGDKIVFNYGNHIWISDKSTKNQRIIFEGFKPVISKSNTFIAGYTKDGITIADSSGKVLKKIDVNYWERITPTFSHDEESISYFDKERESCFLFNWKNETNRLFGKNVYHPSWSPDGSKILFNFGKIDSNFRVAVVDSSWKEGLPMNFITGINENALLPIWSPKQNFISYMILTPTSSKPESDLIGGNIILFDLKTKIKTIMAEDAGFTEGAYPQFCFDEDEKYFYYTSINSLGNGAISKIDLLNNFQKEILTHDNNLDCRLPSCR
jgi:Tol biopolymer transport system component